MSKKFLTEKDRLNTLKERGDKIKEAFKKEFNKIKRIDEGEFDSRSNIEIRAKEDSRCHT